MRITSNATDIPIEVRLCEKNLLDMTDEEGFAYIESLQGRRMMKEQAQTTRKPREPKETKPKNKGFELLMNE